MKFISWNVNGLRAVINKGFFDFFKEIDADIFCIQETKMQKEQATFDFQGYYEYWNCAEKKGYSGTLILTKKKPISESYGITASGAKVQSWYTVAAGKAYPMGTVIYIPALKNKPNGGWFVVQDRGGAIKNNKLDIYMSTYNECIQFGRKKFRMLYICKIIKIFKRLEIIQPFLYI